MRGLVLSSLAIIAIVGPLSAAAERADDRPYDRLERDGDVDADGIPVGAYRVHEWGVWQLDARGRVRSLEDVARESPAFVHRQRGVPASPPELPPERTPRYEVYDKPVLFFYADAPIDITFTVRTPGGRPWLYYPSATVGRVGRDNALRFSGRLLANEPLPANVRYPEPPAGHWWSILRGVNASPFVSSEGTEAERFVFYDGQGPFPRGFTRRRRELVPVEGHVEPVAWLLESGTATRLTISGTRITREPIGRFDRMATELQAALVAHGLTGPEANSLIATWRPELFQSAHKRVVWLLPRTSYDAMLPISFSLTPRELVRVGLVIEAL